MQMWFSVFSSINTMPSVHDVKRAKLQWEFVKSSCCSPVGAQPTDSPPKNQSDGSLRSHWMDSHWDAPKGFGQSPFHYPPFHCQDVLLLRGKAFISDLLCCKWWFWVYQTLSPDPAVIAKAKKWLSALQRQWVTTLSDILLMFLIALICVTVTKLTGRLVDIISALSSGVLTPRHESVWHDFQERIPQKLLLLALQLLTAQTACCFGYCV